jgi:hypothetical protein
VIAHEMTHAVVDRLRPYFMEPSNNDVLAFHEGSPTSWRWIAGPPKLRPEGQATSAPELQTCVWLPARSRMRASSKSS